MTVVRRFTRFFSGAGLLALSPLLVSLATFISVPIVIATLGSEVWVSIAVGQALGEIARVVVIWGWNSTGLARIARRDADERLAAVRASYAPRAVLLVLALCAVVVISFLLPVQENGVVALVAAAGAVTGLSSGWYFVGSREPVAFFLGESMPRAAGILLASVAMWVHASATLYGCLTALGMAVSVLVPMLVVRRRAMTASAPRPDTSPRAIARALRDGASAAGTGFLRAARIGTPVVIAPVLTYAGSATIALGDKLLRWINTGITPLMQSLQIRVPKVEDGYRRGASRLMLASAAFGLVVAAAVALVLPAVSHVISLGEIPIDFSLSVPIAVIMGALFVSGVVGNGLLVALDSVHLVFRIDLIALPVFAALFIPMTLQWGPLGAFWALALVELFVVVAQIFVHHRRQKKLT